MYNVAAGQVCDPAVLEGVPSEEVRDWTPFSLLKLREALGACSSRSAPGLDHVMWSHLKVLLSDTVASEVVLVLANACLWVRYWPSYFKESVLVIILKPGKP